MVTGLLATLAAWYFRQGSLEVRPLADVESEIWFWIGVVFSNSLGTAFGDAMVDVIGLSYLQGALVCSAVIAVVLGLHYFTKVNEIALFWVAFIFTRPFGATFGDMLSKPKTKGGLELGTLQTSLVCAALLAAVVFVGSRLQKAGSIRLADERPAD